MKPYVLPELGYDFSALEPHYSARMLELHHDKHHKAYVDGVNATLEKLAAAREKTTSVRSSDSRRRSRSTSRATCCTRSSGRT